MAEYIEREAAIRKINGEFPDAHYPSWYAALIKDIPAADVVEVVRCKDCKYSMLWRNPSDGAIGDCWIRKMYSEDEQFCMVGADDFCSLGKRRDE